MHSSAANTNSVAHKITISPLAHLDEFEAYKWYEHERTGLGEELLSELETAYHKIAEHPEYFSFIDQRNELRDYLLPRFPFLIVFGIAGDTIEIITVHHTKKHPSKKYGITDL